MLGAWPSQRLMFIVRDPLDVYPIPVDTLRLLRPLLQIILSLVTF